MQKRTDQQTARRSLTPSQASDSGTGSNIELNLIASDSDDRDQLKAWFDRLWADPNLVKDVKADVLQYLAQVLETWHGCRGHIA